MWTWSWRRESWSHYGEGVGGGGILQHWGQAGISWPQSQCKCNSQSWFGIFVPYSRTCGHGMFVACHRKLRWCLSLLARRDFFESRGTLNSGELRHLNVNLYNIWNYCSTVAWKAFPGALIVINCKCKFRIRGDLTALRIRLAQLACLQNRTHHLWLRECANLHCIRKLKQISLLADLNFPRASSLSLALCL